MVMALVAALTTTVATLSIRNLQSARLSQQGGVAVNAADAGVAQAVSFLRANGLHDLCPAPTFHNPPAPDFNKGFDLATQSCVTGLSAATQVPGQPYRVVIVTRAAYPTNGAGQYTVYSKGVGAGQASRLVAADVTVTGGGAPRGSSFFGHEIRGAGNIQVRQSIFATGCVYNRGSIKMNEDPNARDAYGLPPAVHSSGFITDDGVNSGCSRSRNSIHNTNVCAPLQPFDQDVIGGPLPATSACVTSRPPNVPTAIWDRYYPVAEGSRISSAQRLLSLFDLKDPALDQADIDRLRIVAKSQGPENYRTTTSSSDVVRPSGAQAVLFYDLTVAGGSVNLGNIQGFGYSVGCPSRSLVVVVVGGNTTYPSGGPLVASVFVTSPGMMYSANGGVLVGSVFADKISLGGNAIVSQEAQTCADSNPSPTLLDFNVTSYRELDAPR
jgi:hypothetical protein